MEDELITLETAELAKKAGFNWGVFYSFNPKGKSRYWDTSLNFNDSENNISQPTQTQLQRWLREVKHQCFTIVLWHRNSMKYAWKRWPHFPITDYYFETSSVNEEGIFNTWEEAMEAGLQHCLKCLLDINNIINLHKS